MNLRKHPALILVILISVSAAGVAWWCMSSGVGVSPDSVIYLSVADSLIAGRGLKPIAFHYTPKVPAGKPLVTFPPVYPLLLSLSRKLNADQLSSARWLHSLLFAANTFLVGLLLYLGTARSAMATLGGTLLFVSSSSVLEIHTMVWSEAPFVLFILLAALLLILHFARPHYLLLVGASVSASLAATTRYAGVTVFPPMIITVLLLENEQLRTRIRNCLIIAGLGSFPLAVWLLRNIMVADSATNRSVAFHLLKISDLYDIVNSLLMFWMPVPGNAYLKLVLLFLWGGLVLAGFALALKNLRPERDEKLNSGIQMFAAVFVTTYLLFLCTYNSLIDPVTDLGTRVLLPVYVFGLILIVSVLHKLSRLGNRITLRRGVLVLALALISVNFLRAASFAVRRHGNGSGYTSQEWARSQTIAYIKTLPETGTTYSNGVDAIYFLAGKEALRIPARFNQSNGKSYAEFEQDINSMRNEVIQNRAVVVYLDRITGRAYLPTKDELTNVYKLPVLIQLDDGIVYGIK